MQKEGRCRSTGPRQICSYSLSSGALLLADRERRVSVRRRGGVHEHHFGRRNDIENEVRATAGDRPSPWGACAVGDGIRVAKGLARVQSTAYRGAIAGAGDSARPIECCHAGIVRNVFLHLVGRAEEERCFQGRIRKRAAGLRVKRAPLNRPATESGKPVVRTHQVDNRANASSTRQSYGSAACGIDGVRSRAGYSGKPATFVFVNAEGEAARTVSVHDAHVQMGGHSAEWSAASAEP